MTNRGDKIVYRSFAGFRHDAEVRAVREGGLVDIAVDTGCSEPLELTRVAFVAPEKLLPGTCSTGSREKP